MHKLEDALYRRVCVCVCVCVYVCTYVCMYVVCMYDVCMYVCMMYVCMFVCMYVYLPVGPIFKAFYVCILYNTGRSKCHVTKVAIYHILPM